MSRLCNGDIANHELKELSALLNNNEDAIREYTAYTALHLQLGIQLRNPDSTEHVTPRTLQSAGNNNDLSRTATNDSRLKSWFARRYTMFVVAASLLGLAAYLLLPFQSSPVFTARILQKIDCDWDLERWGTPQAAELVSGREINLERGLMVLEFGNGAELMLEAPVRFKILARDCGALISGKLTARVPKRGKGFTVQVPLGEVVDLGTSFGLQVDGQGNCHTHVFKGNVVMRSDLGPGGQPQREWDLAAGAAMKLDVSGEVKHYAAQPSSFAHSLRKYLPRSTADEASQKILSSAELLLWLDSSSRLQLDSEGRVISWGDLTPDSGSGEEGAWQVDAKHRPLWKKQLHGNKPALRFNGTQYLVTTPFLSRNQVSIVCVFQGRPAGFSNPRSAQLLNLNGSTSLTLQQTQGSKMLAALFSGKQAASDRIIGSLPTNNGLVVSAYVYDLPENQSALYLNRKLIGKSTASQDVAISSPKYIGCSNVLSDFFSGDIYEILVFDSVLSAEQCIQMSDQLMKKYGISEEDREPRVLSGFVPVED